MDCWLCLFSFKKNISINCIYIYSDISSFWQTHIQMHILCKMLYFPMKDNLGDILQNYCEFSKKGNFLREVSGITTPIPWRSEAQSLNQESKCFLCARIIHLIHSFDSCFNILIYHTNCDHIFYKWLRENESSHCWLFLFLFDGSGIWITIKSLKYLEIRLFWIYSP